MARVNILKKIKAQGRWSLQSIPKKANGNWDWGAVPDGRYFIEWYEKGQRRRESAGTTVAQATEAHRRKRHQLEGITLGLVESSQQPVPSPSERSIEKQIEHYLRQIETLKKPNTHRKYEAVLNRFGKEFGGQTIESVSVEQLNEFAIALIKRGMSANTVLHNIIIVAQFFRRNGRPGLTRELHLPEKISTLPREYSEEELERFFGVCSSFEKALYSTFLLTGMREQEVMYLYWTDLKLSLRTVRVTAKPDRGFYPKRWEEREIPIPNELVSLLQAHPRTVSSPFVFPSREQNMLRLCKDVAKRAGITTEFDLKTFRSTYATRMLRSGFDVRTVQHWMGHKSLETTMRYLVPATDVHDRLDKVKIPSAGGTPRKPISTEPVGRVPPVRKPAAPGNVVDRLPITE